MLRQKQCPKQLLRQDLFAACSQQTWLGCVPTPLRDRWALSMLEGAERLGGRAGGQQPLRRPLAGAHSHASPGGPFAPSPQP